MDLLTAFKNYLFSQDKKPSLVTVKNYLSDINHFVKWFEKKYLKAFNPSEVTKTTIESYKLDTAEIFSASSLERHLSSLRKFFYFLKLEGKMTIDPFKPLVVETNSPKDPWHLKDFKSFLYIYNASHLTIKNYLIDIKQFMTWAQEVTGINELSAHEANILNLITPNLIEEYKQRLLSQGTFSPATINRKLSSLRKYTLWAAEEGLLKQNEFNTSNVVIEEPKVRSLEAQTPLFTQLPSLDKQKDVKPYSKFPPLRLFQKVSKAFTLTIDSTIVSGVVKGVEKAEYVLWHAKGKPIFEKAKALRLPKQITHEDILGIKNISKEFYAPLEISTKNFTWYRKAWFTLRYYRPDWYKRYHSYAIVHYFHFAVLVIFLVALGLGFYNGFIKSGNQSPSLAAAPTAPPRVLSFQGRLTDNNDNQITNPTNLRFAIYDTLSSSGSSLLWQEVDQVAPDTDGIFNVILGNNSTIPQSLFANNSALWLGVTVESTPELTPRQPLATVAYATNAEVLQGMPPTTQAGITSYKNVILALDSSGNFNLSDSAPTDHVFQVNNGAFKITGQPLLLTTNVGSNGNVQIGPDGGGRIDLIKPLINTSNSNNIASAVGTVEVDDGLSILASASGQSAFTINATGANSPLISASASGVAKFTVDNSGNIRMATGTTLDTNGAGSLGIGTLNTNALTLGNSGASITLTSSNITVNQNSVIYSGASGVIATANTTTSGQCLVSNTTPGNPSWQTCPASAPLYDLFWNQNNGALSANNSTADFLFGSQSSTSARFRLTANNLGAGTLGVASISGKTSFAVLTVDNQGTGDLITASASGVNQFTVSKAGTVFARNFYDLDNTSYFIDQAATATSASFAGSLIFDNSIASIQNTKNQLLTIGGNSTGNIYLAPNNGITGGVVAPNTNGNVDLGTSILAFRTIYASSDIKVNGNSVCLSTGTNCPASLAPSYDLYWNQLNGAISANNSTTDFLFGSQASISARFRLTANNLGAGTLGVASISGQTSFATLVVDNSGVGDIFTASKAGQTRFTISGNGAITANAYKTCTLKTDVNGLFTCGVDVNTTPFAENLGAIFANNSTEDFLFGSQSSSSARFKLTANNFGAGTLGVASISGQTSFATLVVDNTIGDLFTASRSGASRFSIAGNGLITANAYSNCLLTTNAAGVVQCATGAAPSYDLYWNQSLGALFPNNSTVDFLIGGQSSATAKFSYTGISTGKTQASISGNLIVYPNNGYGGRIGIGTANPTATALDVNAYGTAQTSDLVDIANVAGQEPTLDGVNALQVTWLSKPAAGAQIYAQRINNTNNNTGTGGASGGLRVASTGPGGAINSASVGIFVDGLTNASNGTNMQNAIQIGGNWDSSIYGLSGLRINATGNIILATSAGTLVGINTNTPLAQLDVNGAASASSSLTFRTGASSIQTTSNSLLTIGGNSTGNIFLSPNNGVAGGAVAPSTTGNVDLGTTGLVYRNIYGTTYFTGATQGQSVSNACVNSTNGLVTGTGTCPISNIDTFWNQTNGALFPNNSTADFIIGSQASASARFRVIANNLGAGTLGVASISGQTSFATLVVDNTIGDLFAASRSGQARFSIAGNGVITANAYQNNGGLLFTTSTGLIGQTTVGLGGQCLQSIGGGTPIWGACGSASPFSELTGTIVANNSTEDFLFGSQASISARFKLTANNLGAGTLGVASISGQTSFATLVVDNSIGDIFAASRAGQARFSIAGNGVITANAYKTCTLKTDANGLFTCGADINTSPFAENLGAIFANNSTEDFLIGGQSTIAAQFAITGIASDNPIATLSASNNNGIVISASNSTIQAVRQNGLTLGGNTTGNIILSPLNGIAGSNVVPSTNQQVDLGTSALQWRNIYGQTIFSNGTPLTQYWQRIAGAIAPLTTSDDFLLGGNSTATAEFSYTGISTGKTQASISGSLIVYPNNGYGQVGIGTTNPTSLLSVAAVGGAQINDLVSFSNASGQEPTAAGVNALQLTWNVKPGSGNLIAAQRININNNNTATGGQAQGLRIAARGAGTNVNSDIVGLLIDSLGNASNGTNTQNAIQIGNNWDSSIYGVSDLRINAGGNIIFATSSGTTNVGINTTNPLAKLDVNGTASAASSLTFRTGASSIQTTSNSLLTIGGNSTGNIFLAPNNGIAGGAVAPSTNANVDLGTTGLVYRNIYGTTYFTGATQGQTITNGACLTSTNGLVTGTTSCIDTYWNQTNGVLSPNNTTTDFIIGSQASASARFRVIANNLGAGTLGVASISGQTSFATLVVDNTIGDLFAASRSGQARFSIAGNGVITANAYQNCNLTTNAQGVFQCTAASAATNWWNQVNGLLSPISNNWDFAIGGNSTASALFSYTGVQTGKTQASISGQLFVMPNNGYGGRIAIGTVNPTATALDVNAYGGAQVSDLVDIANVAGQEPTATGVNAIQTTWNVKPAVGSVIANSRFNITNNNTGAGGTGVGLRIAAVGPGTNINSTTIGLLIDSLGKASNGTNLQNAIEIGNNWDSSIYGVSDLRINAGGNIIFATSSGTTNVGINTTNPLAKLDVNGTASAASSLTFRTGASSIQTTSNSLLTLGGASTGNISFNPNNTQTLIVSPNRLSLIGASILDASGTLSLNTVGNQAITTGTGLVTAGGNLNVVGTYQVNSVSGISTSGCVTSTLGIITGTAACPAPGADAFWGQGNGTLYPTNSTTDLLIGNQSSTNSARFRVIANNLGAGTLGVASVSGKTSFATFVVNNDGVGDLFTASASGTPRFVINNNGTVGIGPLKPTLASALQINPFTNTAQTADLVSIGNNIGGGSSQDPTVDGVNALQITWNSKPAAGAQIYAQRINNNNNNTGAGGASGGLRLASTGPGTTINSATVGLFVDGLTNASNGTNMQNAIQIGANWDSSIYGLSDLRINAAGNIILATSAGTLVGINTTSPRANLDVNGAASASSSFTFRAAGAIQTTSNTALTLGGNTTGNIFFLPNNGAGLIGVNTTSSLLSGFDIRGNTATGGTLSVASVSGKTAFSALVANNDLVAGDLFTASSSSQTRFTIKGNGSIIANAYQTCTLKTDANGLITCGTDNVGGGNQIPFEELNGAIVADNITEDFILGSQATAGARFRVTSGILGSGTLGIASISGKTSYAALVVNNDGVGDLITASSSSITRFTVRQNGSIYSASTASITGSLTFNPGGGQIQTVLNQPLTIGGNTTGQIVFSPGNTQTLILSANTLTLPSATTINSTGTLSLNTTNNQAITTGTGLITAGGDIQVNGNDILDSGATIRLSLGATTTLTNTGLTLSGTTAITASSLQSMSTSSTFALNGASTINTDQTASLALFNTGLTGTLNFAGAAGTINIGPGSTTATSINLAGGAGATGCTVDGATGNLACSGNIASTATTGIQGWWNQSNGAIFPINSTADFIFGSQASASARFRIIANNLGAGTLGVASISGQTSFATLVVDNTIGDLFAASRSGQARFSIAGNGLLTANAYQSCGALTTNASGIVQCANGVSPAFDLYWNQQNGAIFPNNSTADLIFGSQASASARFRVVANNLGAGTLTVASISGKTSFATLVINNDGVGDLFTASASGAPRFVINTNGTVGIGVVKPTLATALQIQPFTNIAQTGDLVSIGNNLAGATGQEPTVDGVNALQLSWSSKPAAGAQIYAQRINNTNNNSGAGGASGGLRLVSTGPGGAINSATVGLFIDGLINASSGTNMQNAIQIGANWDSSIYGLGDLRINSARNIILATSSGTLVGINTTSPKANLDIQGGNFGGNSALNVNQIGINTNDIISASASGISQFRLTNGGTIYARDLYDLDNTAYYLNPAGTGTSLNIAGSASIAANLNFNNSNGQTTNYVNLLSSNNLSFAVSPAGVPGALNSDLTGNVGPWTYAKGVMPNISSQYGSLLTANINGNNYLYAMSGRAAGFNSAIQVATISATTATQSANVNVDIPNNWTTVSNTGGPMGVYYHASAIANVFGTNYLYQIGGHLSSPNASTAAVYKSTINTNGIPTQATPLFQGSLSAVNQELVAFSMPTASGSAAIYALGGSSPVANQTITQTTVQRAFVNAGGDISNFSTNRQTQLPQALRQPGVASAIINGTPYAYLVGGNRGNSGADIATTGVYKITFNSLGGDITGITSTGQATFPAPMIWPDIAIMNVGGDYYLYVTGGYNGSNNVWTTYKALIDPTTGNVGAFTTAFQTPIIARRGASGMVGLYVSGIPYLFISGGDQSGTFYGTTQIAQLSESSLALSVQNSGNIGIGLATNSANFALQVAGNIGPSLDNTFDLGSSDSGRWRNLYLGPNSLDIVCKTTDGCDANQTWTVGVNSNMTVNGTTGLTEFNIQQNGSNVLSISEGNGTAMRIYDKGSPDSASAVSYLGFYSSNGTRIGWVGDGSASNDNINLFADTGDVDIQSATGFVGVTVGAGTNSFLCKSSSGTGLKTIRQCAGSAAQNDFGEWVRGTTNDLAEGDIVIPDPNTPDQQNIDPTKRVVYAAKSQKAYDSSAIGVISDWALMSDRPDSLVFADDKKMSVAGVIPVKVTLENGVIHKGDPITASSVAGVGMKSTKAGIIIGKALDEYDGSSATQSARLINGNWVTVSGTCSQGQQNCYNQGKVLALLNVSWFDPNSYLASNDNLNLVDNNSDVPLNLPHTYTLKTPFGLPVDRIGQFADIAAAHIKVGLVDAQQITTKALSVAGENIFINGQNIRDYIAGIVTDIINSTNNNLIFPIASIDVLHTNLISPVANDSKISLKLDADKLSILNGNSASSSAVASFDNQGNATLSGSLTVEQDASIAGTIRARKIIADQIEGLNIQTATLSANYITNVTNIYSTNNSFPTISATPVNNSSNSGIFANLFQGGNYINIATYSSQLAYVENLNAQTATFAQGMMVFGASSLSDTSVTGQLSVNGSLILADNSVNVLGSDLNLQPLRQGGLSIMGGLIYIDTNGNVQFGSDATVKGTLFANKISPIPGSDLDINLASNSAGFNPSLKITNASGSAIFGLNQLGDLVASGEATFSKLNLGGLIAPALAVSPTEIVATGSAGTGVIKANHTEMTIDNKLVTQKSLIYITPTSATGNQVIFLLRQLPKKSFTVGVENVSNIDIPFNWIIVN